ncbi:hypothetical protein C8R45DRAFT_1115423 [Mycena sanguinolenta]|nr:hypothetical protein C8R45DRAFT_1115423 [Mycena sanguinolenta]
MDRIQCPSAYFMTVWGATRLLSSARNSAISGVNIMTAITSFLMTTTVPQELIEAILAHLDPVDDRDSLKSVALVSTEFAGLAQAVLFRRVYLHHSRVTVNWGLTFERALNIFDASPHLSSHVKDLTLILPRKNFLASHAELALLLPRCISVRRLVLKGVAVSWDTLTPDLQSALSAFFRSAVCLEKLHIMHIAAVPQAVLEIAVQCCSVLSLHRVLVNKDDGIPPTEYGAQKRPSLAHLILTTGFFQPGRYLGLMTSAFIGSLQRLTIEKTSFTNDYVRAVESNLTELSLDCTFTYDRFTLPPLSRLTTLELKVLPRALVPPWLPSTVTQLLDVLPELRTLILHVAIQSYPQTLPPETTTSLEAFDAMSGSLSHCVWDLVLHEPRADHGTYRTILERSLPRLRESQALEVRYSAQVDYERSLL